MSKGSKQRPTDKIKFDEGYDRIFNKKTMYRTMIDPPSGWQYGFPKEWDVNKFPKYEDLLREYGYPEEDIPFALEYSRMWTEEIKG